MGRGRIAWVHFSLARDRGSGLEWGHVRKHFFSSSWWFTSIQASIHPARRVGGRVWSGGSAAHRQRGGGARECHHAKDPRRLQHLRVDPIRAAGQEAARRARGNVGAAGCRLRLPGRLHERRPAGGECEVRGPAQGQGPPARQHVHGSAPARGRQGERAGGEDSRRGQGLRAVGFPGPQLQCGPDQAREDRRGIEDAGRGAGRVWGRG